MSPDPSAWLPSFLCAGIFAIFKGLSHIGACCYPCFWGALLCVKRMGCPWCSLGWGSLFILSILFAHKWRQALMDCPGCPILALWSHAMPSGATEYAQDIREAPPTSDIISPWTPCLSALKFHLRLRWRRPIKLSWLEPAGLNDLVQQSILPRSEFNVTNY